MKIYKPTPLKNLSWPQAKSRFPLMNPFGDADKDGVKNFKDCKPFDIKRQGEEHEEKTKDDYGFKLLYKKGGKKTPTAEELVEELE